MKHLAILGSTGSIGKSALEVVSNLADEVKVTGLAAGRNWKLLAEQALRVRPLRVCCEPGEPLEQLGRALAGTGIDVLEGGAQGTSALAAAEDTDTVLAAISGAAGLPAVMESARCGKRILLSNKESLVMAGPLLTACAQRSGAQLIPVDSEHSAIFQAMQAGRPGEVRRVVLTASGGPFLDTSMEDLRRVTPEQALQHPTWKMGPNITIDSATLMNKALEVIEARWLFDLAPEQIEVAIHPQSIVHSLVEFVDGSVVAQMGLPDMRVPLQYALTWPERRPLSMPRFDLAQIGELSFRAPDRQRFGALDLAWQVLDSGGTAGAVLNAANEEARARFLAGSLGFTDIADLVGSVLQRHQVVAVPGLDAVLAADAWAREELAALADTHELTAGAASGGAKGGDQ